jgi:hypothetical protein
LQIIELLFILLFGLYIYIELLLLIVEVIVFSIWSLVVGIVAIPIPILELIITILLLLLLFHWELGLKVLFFVNLELIKVNPESYINWEFDKGKL